MQVRGSRARSGASLNARTARVFLGGTFDPLHNGHLAAARTAVKALDSPVVLVPCAQPAFGKKPLASPRQRLEMLSLTVQYEGGLSVDDREIRRGGTTYTVETLEDLRREHPDDALIWVMGDDVLGSLQDWHRWERLLELAHLLVLERSGRTNLLDGAVSAVIQASECADVGALRAAPAGRVLYLPDAHPKISSSAVRSGVQRDAVPDMVRDYIERTGLYRQPSADGTAS